MPFSKDPNRYDPIYQFILMEMEQGNEEFEIPFESDKRATNVRLTLYGYATAWKTEGEKRALAKDPTSEACFAKYRTLVKYKLVQIGASLLMINRASARFEPPKIISHGGRISEPAAITAEDASRMISERGLEKAQESAKFVDELFKPTGVISGPIGETTREDLNGPDVDNPAE
jgi:hypothetical protein